MQLFTREVRAMSKEILSEGPQGTPRSVPAWVLILLFFAALIPRVSGILTVTNGDENWHASVRVLTGDLSGDAGLNMPLINYINAASFVVLYAVGRLIGVWTSLADFRAQYFLDLSPFVFSGRLASACLAALSAPLAASIAGRMGLSRISSFVVGLLVALLPIGILVSHFARPDAGAATAVLFLCWAILCKLQEPEGRWVDVLLGIAVAFALSIKQTNVFVVFPVLAGCLALLITDRRLTRSRLVQGLLISIVSCVVVAIPLTIGVLIDIHGFLDYQRVSAAINTRQTTFAEFVAGSLPFFLGNIGGLTVAGLVAYLVAPFIRRDAKFLLFWISAAIGFCVFSYLAGKNISPRYVHPYVVLAFTFGCIAIMSLYEQSKRGRLVASCLGALVLISELAGSGTLIKEALTAPISVRSAEILAKVADPSTDKILSNLTSRYGIGLPVSVAAQEDAAERHERLARKYNIKLNEVPEERQKGNRRDRFANAYYVREFPVAMGGMEDLDKEKAEKVVKPYYWPVQDEEWNIDYWTAQGFTFFVVQDEDMFLKSGVAAYRKLHQEIKDRGELIATIPAGRPHFFETEVKIYRLAKRG